MKRIIGNIIEKVFIWSFVGLIALYFLYAVLLQLR